MFQSKILRSLKSRCKILLLLILSLLFVFTSFTFSPTPAKAAELMDDYFFADDFSTYSLDSFPSQYWTDAVGNGGWAVKDNSGNQIFKQSNTSGGQHIAVVDYGDSENWTDYSVSAHVVTYSGYRGVVGRFQDEDNFYHARFLDSQRLSLVKSVNGTHYSLGEVSFSYTNDWYLLELQMYGSTLRVLVDGVVYITATDSTYSSGSAGLRAAPDLEMKADNFKVSFPKFEYDDFSTYDVDSFPAYYWTDALDNGGWAVKDDGGNVLKQCDTTGGEHIAYVDNIGIQDFQNYDISAKIKPLGDYAGVVGRLQDEDNYYAARFYDEDTLSLVKCVSGTETSIDEVSFPYSTSEWYYLKLEMHGDILRVLVDGEEYITASDTTFSSGRPGLRAGSNEMMEADDFYVYTPEFSNIPQLDFSVGRLADDTSPTSGAIVDWGYIGNQASDDPYCSFGFDMGTETYVDRVELYDSNTSTRAYEDDYEVYISDDNVTYTEVDFTFSTRIAGSKLVHAFNLSDVETRYIKIHSLFSSGYYTFYMAPFHTNVKIYGSPCYRLRGAAGYMYDDDSPTSTGMSYWGFDETELGVDRYDCSYGMDLGGAVYSNRLEIRDDDDSTRAGSGNYTLYYSNDNSSYTQMSGVTFTSITVEDERIIHRFDYPLVNARYIKLHTSYSDGSDDFTLTNLQDDLRVYGPSDMQDTKLSSTSGYLNNDTSPTSGALSNWATTGSIDVDYQSRSVGLDLGSTQRVNVIKLVDSDSSTRGKQFKYELYYSNDNSTYTQITGSQFKYEVIDNRLVHTFEFTGIEARYIKVHTVYTDTSSDFTLNKLQVDLKAYSKAPPRFYRMPATVGYLTSDSTPASGAIGDWGSGSSYNFDTTSNSVGIDLGEELYVNKVELCDTDATHRGTVSNYAVYYSNDNSSYTQASGLTMIDGRESKGFFLTFNEVSARYIKIHTTYTDSPQLVLSDLQDDVRAFSDHEEVSRLFQCTSGIAADTGYGTQPEILVMKNGDLLMSYSVTDDIEHAFEPYDIVGRTSSDGGATWSDQFTILSKVEEESFEEDTMYVSSHSFIRMADGDLGMVYLRFMEPEKLSEHIYIRRLSDEVSVAAEMDEDWSEDWEDPVQISGVGSSPDTGCYYIVNSRVIRLENGRIIVPTCWTTDVDTGIAEPESNIGYMFYSDNDGVTWYNSHGYNDTGRIVLDEERPYGSGWLEPGVIQLPNGDVMSWCRTRHVGAMFKSVSTNNGLDWSAPYRQQGVQTVSSPSQREYLPYSNTQLMIWNNNYSNNNEPRVPLTAALSRDHGLTWSNFNDIETDNQAFNAYIYTSITFSGRKVMLGEYRIKYGANPEMPLAYKVFDIQWLEN